MKYPISCIVAILCMVCCISCELRDPERELQTLSSTAFEPQKGVEKAKEYINHFSKNKKAHKQVQDVNNICYEYQKMVDFDNRNYIDCVSMIADGREIDSELSKSQSPGVRTAWSRLYRDKRKQTQQMQMDALSEADFSRDLSNAVRKKCNDSYWRWKVESVGEISIGPAELIEDGIAKRCSAEYTITLRGTGLGWFTNSARVSAIGKYSFDSNGDLHFTLVDYNLISGPKPERDIAGEIIDWIIPSIIPFIGNLGDL